jgi:putative ABC transport system permease protein
MENDTTIKNFRVLKPMGNKPPYWILKFLRWFCPSHILEEIEGDLFQKFERDIKSFGIGKARRGLMWNTIRFFRPGIVLRNKFSIELDFFPMILNNLFFSLRHLRRQKLNSLLHVTGLALGMSVCILIGLFIQHELSFDDYHSKADRIYRVNSVWTEAGKQFNLYASPLPLAEAIRNEISGIETVALGRPQFKAMIEINSQKIFKQDHVLIVEPAFLDIFNIEILSGDAKKTLLTPYQAIVTETIAKKYFGIEDAIGKTFKYRDKFIITIGAIMRDLPSNTSLPVSMLLSYVPTEEFLDHGDTWYFGDIAWTKLAAVTYIVLVENNDPKSVETQLKQIADRNINSAPTLDKAIRGAFEIQPLEDIHFDKKRFGGGPWVAAIDFSWLWFFACIGLIVLTLACINFINLSTAQAFIRAKEVGIRKSIGARRSQLIGQFTGEAFIITIISGLIAITIVQLSLYPLNDLLEKGIVFNLFQSPGLIIGLLLFVGFTALSAGLYPAWITSEFNPIVVLKSNSAATGIHKLSWLRKGLVVIQFTISTGLFMAVLLIAQQVDFIRNNDLGFETENIINVELGNQNKRQAFSNELKQIRGVKDISLARSSPISNDHWWNTISKTEKEDRQSVCAIYGDDHFYDVYGLKLLSGIIPQEAGNNSNKDSVEKSITRVVVNEKLLEALDLGSPQEAVGKLFWWGGDTEIAGVVADFNTEPLKYAISPTLIVQDYEVYSHASIRLESNAHLSETLTQIESVWKKHFTDEVYEFQFLDHQIDSFYKMETRLYTLFKISCLGLWGLVVFVSQQRTKEIGIRKVLGASVNAILWLLSKDFFLMILMAFVIASPLTYYFINDWLQNFAFRIDIGWEIFVMTVLFLIAVVSLTISVQTIKSSIDNPVNSLRSE